MEVFALEWDMRHRGYTLVEVLVVVTVLSILAAIVVPRYVAAQEQAKENAAAAQLVQIRSALERFKIHHDRYPKLHEVWHVLVKPTNKTGQITADGPFGPYMTEPPTNPWTYVDRVQSPLNADPEAGYIYDQATGWIEINGFDENRKKYLGQTFDRAVQLQRNAQHTLQQEQQLQQLQAQ